MSSFYTFSLLPEVKEIIVVCDPSYQDIFEGQRFLSFWIIYNWYVFAHASYFIDALFSLFLTYNGMAKVFVWLVGDLETK